MYCFISYKLIIDVHEDTKVTKIVSEGCVTCKWTSTNKQKKQNKTPKYMTSLCSHASYFLLHILGWIQDFQKKILSSDNLNLEIFTYILYCLTLSWSHFTSLSTNEAYTFRIYSYILMYIEVTKLSPIYQTY